MIPKHIQNSTRTLNKPANWDNDEHGQCVALPIRDEVVDGVPFMISAWEPSPAELAALNSGAPIILHISGVSHPVVGLGVGEVAE